MDLPKWDLTPRQEIQHELNDLVGVTRLLQEAGVLPERGAGDFEEVAKKMYKVRRLMGYARNEGTLNPQEQVDV